MMEKEIQHFDIIVIGSGVAGLSNAIYVQELAIQLNISISILVIAKGNLDRTNTNWAQGGIAAVMHTMDSFEAHIQDTLGAGANTNDLAIVEKVVRNGPDLMQDLLRWGMDLLLS